MHFRAELKYILWLGDLKASLNNSTAIKRHLTYIHTCITGTTTTGNVCRLGFKKPKKLAAMLGIPVWIVRNFATILQVCCEKKAVLDPDAFEKFCDDHLEKWYDSPYAWNMHNPTTHIPYIHGADILRMFPCPVGLMSEEGSEVEYPNLLKSIYKNIVMYCSCS